MARHKRGRDSSRLWQGYIPEEVEGLESEVTENEEVEENSDETDLVTDCFQRNPFSYLDGFPINDDLD